MSNEPVAMIKNWFCFVKIFVICLTNSFWRSCECDSSSSVCLPRETLNLHTKLAQYSIGGEGSGSRIKSINSLPQGNFSQTSFSDSSSFSLLQEHIICDELFVYTATLFLSSFPRKGQIHLAPEDSAFQRKSGRGY